MSHPAQGKLRAGSPTCRLFSRLEVNFLGGKGGDEMGPHMGAKGIGTSTSQCVLPHVICGSVDGDGRAGDLWQAVLSVVAPPGDVGQNRCVPCAWPGMCAWLMT